MRETKSPVRRVELPGRNAQIQQNPIQFFFQPNLAQQGRVIPEIHVNEGHPVFVFRQPLTRIINRIQILIQPQHTRPSTHQLLGVPASPQRAIKIQFVRPRRQKISHLLRHHTLVIPHRRRLRYRSRRRHSPARRPRQHQLVLVKPTAQPLRKGRQMTKPVAQRRPRRSIRN